MNAGSVGDVPNEGYSTLPIKELQNKKSGSHNAGLSRLQSILRKSQLSHLPRIRGLKVKTSHSFQKNAENTLTASLFFQKWMPDATIFKSFSERLAQLFAVISVEMRKTLEEPEKKFARHKFKRKVEKNAKSKRLGK